MKKHYTTIISLTVILVIIALSCTKKNSTGIAPGFKADTGTGGNPNANNPTVTGATTNSNLATQNSNLSVGGSGWSNPTCSSTYSLILKGTSGNVNVLLTFPSIPTSTTYAISSAASATACTMIVTEAPNQPSGTIWYGRSGQVVVNVSAASINATFTGIQCVQQTFNYPVVTVSGALGCSQ